MKIYKTSKIPSFIVATILIVLLTISWQAEFNNVDKTTWNIILITLGMIPIIFNQKSYLVIDENGIKEFCFRKVYDYKWDEVYNFEIVKFDGREIIGFMVNNSKDKPIRYSPLYKNGELVEKDKTLNNDYKSNLEDILEEINKTQD